MFWESLLVFCFSVMILADGKNMTINGTAPMKRENGTAEVHKREVISAVKGKQITLDCSVTQNRDAVVSWKAKKNTIKEEKKKYTFVGKPLKKMLQIEELTFSDRDVYTCLSSYGNSTSTIMFTLRVRDPLGALWPVIGIAIETLLLFVIIWMYEYSKSKPTKEKGRKVKASIGEDGEMMIKS